jgi:hypothetical protein
MKTALFASLLLVIASCNGTTDITRDPSAMSDFIVGKVYELKKAVWIRDQAMLTLRGKEPADSKGVLVPGTLLVVRKVAVERSREVGPYTDVFMEVLTGEHAGKVLNAGVISETLKTGFTKRDPEMLEPVEK